MSRAKATLAKLNRVRRMASLSRFRKRTTGATGAAERRSHPPVSDVVDLVEPPDARGGSVPRFKVEATPLAEAYGGLPEDHPDMLFIDGNLPGLAGAWAYDGSTFAVVYEPIRPEEAVAELGRLRGGQATALDGYRLSYGSIWFQAREEADVIHVEYCAEVLRAQTVAEESRPCHDTEVERGLRTWLEENESAVVETIKERSGELRG
jgi:hypothetical protein